jgi:predicted metalloprotease
MVPAPGGDGMNRLVRVLFTFALLMGIIASLATATLAQETGSREDDDEQSAESGEGFYESPSYGYTVEYDDSWEVEEDESQGGYDLLKLTSEGSSFYLEGYPGYDGDAESCVTSQVDNFEGQPSVDNFEIIEDEDGEPIESYDADASSTLFGLEFTSDDGDTNEFVIYLECRPLQEGSTVIVFTQFMSYDNYEDELGRKDQIVDTLDLTPVDEVDAGSTDDDEQADDEQTDDENVDDDVAHTIELLETVQPDIDAYWTQVFEQSGMGEYEPPAYVNFTEPVDTACGAAEPGQFGPFYCFFDNTVYMDVLFMSEYYLDYGDFVVFRSVAHEVGHHVQNLMDIRSCGGVTNCLAGYTTLDVELMADCFAGSWAQNADDRGIIAPGDVENAIVALAAFLGDPAFIDMTDPNAHGPGSLRTWWFLRGFYEGASACVNRGVDQQQGGDVIG